MNIQPNNLWSGVKPPKSSLDPQLDMVVQKSTQLAVESSQVGEYDSFIARRPGQGKPVSYPIWHMEEINEDGEDSGIHTFI